MNRAEELANELFPEPKLENYDDILIYRADRDNAIMGRAMCYRVYEQAKKDLELTVEDIKSIIQIADKMLDDTKARVEYQNHNEEYYYKRVLDEYELHKTKEE